MKATIGRIVHVIVEERQTENEDGDTILVGKVERPAIITEVHNPEEDGTLVSLVIFGKDLTGASIPRFSDYDEGKAYGTWHWPERE